MATDYAGEWIYKGTISPRFDDWTQFPFASNEATSIIRVSCIAANPDNVKSYGYLRAVYDVGNLNYGRWHRIWFSEEPQLINLHTPEEILINQTVIRYYQAKKVLKRGWRRVIGTVNDEYWGMAIESLAQTNLPADVLSAIEGTPVKVLNAGGSGNIVIVLTAQETQNG